MIPAPVPLTAWRNARFVEERQFTVSDLPFDFTGYTDALLEVRQYGAQAGAAEISIGLVTTAIEGVRFLEPANGILAVRIDQTTLAAAYAALSGGVESGAPVNLFYDLRLTAADGADELWMQGDFIIYPGVSINV